MLRLEQRQSELPITWDYLTFIKLAEELGFEPDLPTFDIIICPVCNGAGKIMDDSTASLNLVVMWDYKDWKQFIGPSNTAQLAEAEAMTLSEISTYDELLKVQEVILDTTVANGYATQRFNRVGRPNLLGLGSSEFVLAFWKRIQ